MKAFEDLNGYLEDSVDQLVPSLGRPIKSRASALVGLLIVLGGTPLMLAYSLAWWARAFWLAVILGRKRI